MPAAPPSRHVRASAAGGGARYAGAVATLDLFKFFLTGFAVVGIAYVCIGSGVFRSDNQNWWAGLPQHKKVIFGSALGATLLQTFL